MADTKKIVKDLKDKIKTLETQLDGLKIGLKSCKKKSKKKPKKKK